MIERVYYIDRATAPSGGFFGDATGANIRLQFYEFATGRTSTITSNLGPVVGVTAARDGRIAFSSRTDFIDVRIYLPPTSKKSLRASEWPFVCKPFELCDGAVRVVDRNTCIGVSDS